MSKYPAFFIEQKGSTMSAAFCSKCGKKLIAGDAFCSRCGAPVQTDQDGFRRSDGAQSVITPQTDLIRCKDCGREISPRAPVCPYCGISNRSFLFRKLDWGFEWKSSITIGSIPLIHIAVGRSGGRLRVAKGIIAIGQFAIGLITIAQFGIGILFGFGQFILGFTAVAQFAMAVLFGLGQFATGYTAIGQFAVGYYVLAQAGFGAHVWRQGFRDPTAVEYFKQLWNWLGAQ
jgi:hypothetical protein